MQGDLSGVRLHAQELADPPRGEICAVTEGDQLALALVELRESIGEREPLDGLLLETPRASTSGGSTGSSRGAERRSAITFRAMPSSQDTGSPRASS